MPDSGDQISVWRSLAAEAAAGGHVDLQRRAEAKVRELEAKRQPTAAPPPAAAEPTSDYMPAPASAAPAAEPEHRPAPERPGLVSRAADWTADAVSRVGHGALGELHTIGALFGALPRTPEDTKRIDRMNYGLDRINNMYTFGAWRPIADATGASSPQFRERVEKEVPRWVPGASDAIGATIGAIRGPAAMLDSAVRTGVNAVAPLAESAVARLLAGGASGVTENAAARFGTTPGTARERLAAAGEGNAPAAVIGAGGAALGELAEAGAGLTRKNKWIGEYRKNVNEGRYQRELGEPELDQQAARDQGADQFARRNAELEQQGIAELDAARAPHLQTPVSNKGIYADLQARIKANLDSQGKPIDPVLQEELQGMATEFFPWTRGPNGQRMKKPDLTYDDIIKKRAALREAAKFESRDGTGAAGRARIRYDVLREAIQGGLPAEAVAAEGRAAAGASARRGERDFVYGTEGHVGEDVDSPDVRAGKQERAGTVLGRVDDVDVAGMRKRSGIESLEEADPEMLGGYAGIIDDIRATKALEATAPGLTTKVPTTFAGGVTLGGMLPFTAQLGRYVGGRLVEPALMRGVAPAARAAPRLVPSLMDPLQAVMSRRKKQRGE